MHALEVDKFLVGPDTFHKSSIAVSHNGSLKNSKQNVIIVFDHSPPPEFVSIFLYARFIFQENPL